MNTYFGKKKLMLDEMNLQNTELFFHIQSVDVCYLKVVRAAQGEEEGEG